MGSNTDTYIFDECNYSEEVLIFYAKFRQEYHGYPRKIQSIFRISSINTLDVSYDMGMFEHLVNATTHGKYRLYMYVCNDNSFLFLNENSFTEVSITLRSVTLVGFKKDLQEPSVTIGSGEDDMDTPKCNHDYSSQQ